MHIVIAPDSFKGSLTAGEAASAIAIGVKQVFPKASISKVPVADGGEGTIDALTQTTHGKIMTNAVMGPLNEPINADWYIFSENTVSVAVIEMAKASGLLITPENKRDIRHASTYGTGQLIKAALDAGVGRIIIGIGGSATNDGGAGMAAALGVKFFDKNHQIIPAGGAALSQLAYIDTTNIDKRICHTDICIASDVDNPLCGPAGASAVYGPQKGARPETVTELDAALLHYSNIAKHDIGIDVSNIPGSGAAGGLGAGLMLFTNGRIISGSKLILDTINFPKIIAGAAFIITGEGYTDEQTIQGKVPIRIAEIAKRQDIPVICLSGALSEAAHNLANYGVSAVAAIPYAPCSLDYCMENAALLLQLAAVRTCQLIKIGSLMEK
ncbi:glycerate kinase [Pectinatus frisingensis]|uniref:glycerate kinase n=1 Tax=Pectinatus frisingensis TaxID=865 RepID=UPI0018C5633F|nr:glycerate kinase [Pectinatus frisingensis]